MKNELGQQNRGSYKSCYELGVAEGEYDVRFTTSSTIRIVGAVARACLTYPLSCLNGCVHLTAIYRSHDYRYKVLGNMLGLARLQACVAEQVGAPIGTLVVHSTYAFVDLQHGKAGCVS